MAVPSEAAFDPGRQLAFAMADIEADEHRYPDALQWLEVGAERAPLPRSYRAKRDAWLRRTRRTGDMTPRSGRRRIAPRLPAD